MSTPGENVPLSRGLWAKLLPELSSVVLLGLIASGVASSWTFVDLQLMPMLMLMTEGAMLLLMWTLVDIATRLRAPPPWWLGVAIVAGLFAMYPDARNLLQTAWDMGVWIFVPIAWSVLERLRELWTLPRASTLEKYRRRALSAGRVITGLIAAGASIVILLVDAVRAGTFVFSDGLISTLIVWMLLAFYLIAAYDAWRVHGPAFARRPRQLWRTSHDDTDYLAPL